MFKILTELVNKMSDGKQKSEFLAELKKYEDANLITMPESLELLLKDEKFADFKSQHDAMKGKLRTNWDDALKESKLKEELEKTDGKEPNTTENLLKEFMAGINKSFEKINTDISGLRGEKIVGSLKDYAKEKLKDLPESYIGLVDFTEKMTESDIDKKVELLTKIRESDLKNIDNSPNIGQGTTADGGVAEMNEILDEKLGTEKE